MNLFEDTGKEVNDIAYYKVRDLEVNGKYKLSTLHFVNVLMFVTKWTEVSPAGREM